VIPVDPMEAGEEGFLAGLRRCGCEPEKRNDVIVLIVVAIGGSHAGEIVETGVSADELSAWPGVPPHWVHLPSSVTIARTNTRPSPIPGWLMHSRSITGWGNAEEPTQAWIAHARSVIEEA
jgi:hypothetical protein